MNNNWQTALGSAIKQGLRIVLIAIIPLLITGLQSGVINWQTIVVTATITLLMSLDKFVNKWDGTSWKGITPIK